MPKSRQNALQEPLRFFTSCTRTLKNYGKMLERVTILIDEIQANATQ